MQKLTLESIAALGKLEKRLHAAETAAKPPVDDSVIAEDSPLGAEIKRLKESVGGDLRGLPPGHPLFRILEDAKRRFEEKLEAETAGGLPSVSAVKPSKQSGNRVASSPRRAADVDRVAADEMNKAARNVNNALDNAGVALNQLLEAVRRNVRVLARDQKSRVKCVKIERFVLANMRMLRDVMMDGAR